MNLLLLHPDLRSGYRLSRHLHRHSRHHVVAVVQAPQDVPAVLQRCRPDSDIEVQWLVCVATGEAPPSPPGLSVVAFPVNASGAELVKLLDQVDPSATPPNPRAQIYRDMEHELKVQYFGVEESEFLLLPRLEYFVVLDRIDALQGQSPRSRAWPTEGGNEPAPEPGWDPTGTFRPDVMQQVFEEWKAAGKI
ncbi:MAG: hypothetical protein FD161_1833 [Limisphaerales bacterium]|nr:MAG: hypothetical protein FD161_1833 [Limisphaerales bacterium]TXT49072.1 MAG: hypothetical protein FD140_3323 [Limisphaerales bacterium]